MKATKLMDSLNYLDDDLINESESSFKATPLVKFNKTTVIRIVSIAASLVIVSLVVVNLFSTTNKFSDKTYNRFEDKNDVAFEETPDMQETAAAAGEIDGELVTGEENFAPESDDVEEEGAATESEMFVVFNDSNYYLFEEECNIKNIGELLGVVSDSSDTKLIDCNVYYYSENVIAVEYDDSFMLFELN